MLFVLLFIIIVIGHVLALGFKTLLTKDNTFTSKLLDEKWIIEKECIKTETITKREYIDELVRDCVFENHNICLLINISM